MKAEAGSETGTDLVLRTLHSSVSLVISNLLCLLKNARKIKFKVTTCIIKFSRYIIL